MIPSHDSAILNDQFIRVVKLDTLQSYDFGVPHRHEYFELFYFEKAEGTHMIDFIEHPIQDNCVHIVGPGQIHQVKRSLNSNGFVILFHQSAFEGEELIMNFLYHYIFAQPENNQSVFTSLTSSVMSFYFDEIWRANEGDKQVQSSELKNLVGQVIIQCVKASSLSSFNQSDDYSRFRSALKEHFKTKRKVKDYSDLLGVSDKTLNALCKTRVGKNASEIIYDHIILEAKRLLKLNQSVKYTAIYLNFSDPSHFSKFFKAQTGISPKDFQKVHVYVGK